MENTIVKELPSKVQKQIDAIIESEFDLDIRVFTLEPREGTDDPQNLFSIASCNTCISCQSCVSCQLASCWTCTCFTSC